MLDDGFIEFGIFAGKFQAHNLPGFTLLLDASGAA